MQERELVYAQGLSRLIQAETVSTPGQRDKTKFYRFHGLLQELFPHLFTVCRFEDFDGSILLLWEGRSHDGSLLLMNHHDVVEADGVWKYPPFSGAIAEGKLWGRGTVDTKAGLWAMLQAAEELAAAGSVPSRDIYFVSTCTEECGGFGADKIAKELQRRGIRFAMVLDEGGMILQEPIGGAKGSFAMVGLGEKGSANLKFIARSHGGHASAPGKDTPLVRLGKFMAAAEKSSLFRADLLPTVCKTFEKLAPTMSQPLKFILGHPRLFKPLLCKVLPLISPAAGAMVKTTLAFTMAGGSNGANVLPQEAWVIANMRYSHHQGGEDSIEAVRRLAAKFGIETVVSDPGIASPLSNHDSSAFRLVEAALHQVFPDVIAAPYIMNASSDSRFMSRICDNCLRFAPFRISKEQMDSVHGVNENIDLSALSPAVDFYQHIIKNACLLQ